MDQYHFILIHWIRHLSRQRIHTEISQSSRSMAVSILYMGNSSHIGQCMLYIGSTWNAWFKSWIKKSEGRLLCVSTSLHIHNAKRIIHTVKIYMYSYLLNTNTSSKSYTRVPVTVPCSHHSSRTISPYIVTQDS